jgi:hypothetical protein
MIPPVGMTIRLWTYIPDRQPSRCSFHTQLAAGKSAPLNDTARFSAAPTALGSSPDLFPALPGWADVWRSALRALHPGRPLPCHFSLKLPPQGGKSDAPNDTSRGFGPQQPSFVANAESRCLLGMTKGRVHRIKLAQKSSATLLRRGGGRLVVRLFVNQKVTLPLN